MPFQFLKDISVGAGLQRTMRAVLGAICTVGREHNRGFTRPLQYDSFVSCPVVLSIQVYFFLDDVIKEDDCSHLQ